MVITVSVGVKKGCLTKGWLLDMTVLTFEAQRRCRRCATKDPAFWCGHGRHTWRHAADHVHFKTLLRKSRVLQLCPLRSDPPRGSPLKTA